MIIPSTKAEAASIQAVSPLSIPPGFTRGLISPAERLVAQRIRLISTVLTHSEDRCTLVIRPSSSSTRFNASIAVRDRHAPILAQCPMCDLDPHRRLPPLILTTIHQRHDAQNRGPLVSHRDDLLNRPIFLDICFEDRIKQRVGRQAVFISLVVPQFRGGGPVEDTLGNDSHLTLPVPQRR